MAYGRLWALKRLTMAPALNQHIDPCVGCSSNMGASRARSRKPQRYEMGIDHCHRTGALFTVFQAYEYSHAAFGFSGNIYGALLWLDSWISCSCEQSFCSSA